MDSIEETGRVFFGCTGVVVPWRTPGMNNAFSGDQDEILSLQVLEDANKPSIIQQRVKHIGVIVEEGDNLLSGLPSVCDVPPFPWLHRRHRK